MKKRSGKLDLLHRFILGWGAACIMALVLTYCNPPTAEDVDNCPATPCDTLSADTTKADSLPK